MFIIDRSLYLRWLRRLTLAVCLTSCCYNPTAAQVKEADAPDVEAQADAIRKRQMSIAQQLLQDYPDDFDAWRILGFAYSCHGDRSEMAKCWQRCRELQPQRADVVDQLGRQAFDSEDYEQAIELFETANRLDPELPGVAQRIGNALLNLGRAEEAIVALQKQLDSGFHNTETFFLLGEAQFQSQQLEAAKENYLKAVELQPTHSKAYYGLVRTCTLLKQPDEVAKYAAVFQRLQREIYANDQAVRQEYDDLGKMRNELAITCGDAAERYSRDGQWDTALPLWELAAKSNPEDVRSRNALAQLYTRKRKLTDALRMYAELIGLQPMNLEHYRRYGFLQARLGDLKTAEAAFRRMIKVNPKDPGGYRALAKFYLNTNRQPQQALALAKQSLELSEDAESYFVLGWASAQNRKLEDARSALREALRQSPNNRTYRQLYDAVEQRK